MSARSTTADVLDLELVSQQRGEPDLERLSTEDTTYIRVRVPLLLDLVDTTDPIALRFLLETMRLVDAELAARA